MDYEREIVKLTNNQCVTQRLINKLQDEIIRNQNLQTRSVETRSIETKTIEKHIQSRPVNHYTQVYIVANNNERKCICYNWPRKDNRICDYCKSKLNMNY